MEYDFTQLINFQGSPQSANLFQSKLEEAERNIDIMTAENGDSWMTSILMAYKFLTQEEGLFSRFHCGKFGTDSGLPGKTPLF